MAATVMFILEVTCKNVLNVNKSLQSISLVVIRLHSEIASKFNKYLGLQRNSK